MWVVCRVGQWAPRVAGHGSRFMGSFVQWSLVMGHVSCVGQLFSGPQQSQVMGHRSCGLWLIYAVGPRVIGHGHVGHGSRVMCSMGQLFSGYGSSVSWVVGQSFTGPQGSRVMWVGA